MKVKLVLTAIVMTIVTSCDQKKEVWPYGVFYEVNVRSFADSNGDGIGDLKGMTSRLDYLSDLGVGAIWLSPVMPASSWHKYNISDYLAIDSEYGTLEDFKTLTAEAHKRNIRVIMDVVVCFSSAEHKWFQEAVKNPESQFRNYYVWKPADSVKLLDSESIKSWYRTGYDPSGEFYYSHFGKDLPNLNFDNQQVREEFVRIGEFWLKEMGADGFRLGAAEHIYPQTRRTDDIAFWEWYRKELIKIRPDVCMMGEVWSDARTVAPFLNGIPSLVNFDLYHAINTIVQSQTDTLNLVKQYQEIRDLYKSVNPGYIDATFINNHDFERVLSFMQGDVKRAKLAAAILLTLPGTPYLYYGEELGMLGKMPGEFVREPFLWDQEGIDPLQTSWVKAEYSTSKTVTPLKAQLSDPESMFSYYSKWISYRNRSLILSKGEMRPMRERRLEIVGFVRSCQDAERLVLHNISDVEVTILTSSLEGFDEMDFSTDQASTLSETELRVPSGASVILKKG